MASLEVGKTRAESIAEVQEAIDLIVAYADHMEANDGYVEPLEAWVAGERNTDVLRPYGTFAVLAPFNFPAALSCGMTSAALIAGNTVVFKPSEETPWTGAILGEIFAGAGLPAGVFNLLHGGPETGRALVAAPIDGVAFTGSAEVGRAIARALQEGRYGRPALTEMGGKNPAIVTATADLDAAAEGIARAAFGLSGQKCSACSRAIVHADVHDELVERLVAFTGTLALGDPGERDTFVGPVVNEGAVARFADGRRGRRWRRPDRRGRRPPGGPGRATSSSRPSSATCRAGTGSSARSCSCPSSPSRGPARSTRRWPRPTRPPSASPRASSAAISGEIDAFLDGIEAGVVYVNRRTGATTGAWPGTQTFCGWKSSGSTGKGALGRHYLPQFMREQSRTIVG